MARTTLALATLLLATSCGDDGGDGPDAPMGTAAVRVDRYAFDLDLTTQRSTSTLTLRLLGPGNCITLPSRAPMLDLPSVTLGGAPATATADGTTFTACGAGWVQDTTLELVVHAEQPLATWGGSQVGFSISLDRDMERMFYLVSWVGGCDRFGPCDTAPSAFARYHFTIHHPIGFRALCPGRIVAGPAVTTCDFDYDGGPTYSTFGMIASPSWTETALGTWAGVDVTLYDITRSQVRPLIDATNHAGFLAWMQDRFGPYPYGTELRIITGPTYWSGFEHPGNIVLDTGLAAQQSYYARPVTHVLNHEIAHQWAGDETTLADTYDFVWKESMAEYLSYAYEDEVEPNNAIRTAHAWKIFAQGARYHPVPEDPIRPSLLDYYGEVYGPGPMILFRQLEVLTSRAQVIAAIQMLLGTQRAISVADVQAALESTTGLDLDRYIDVWVRGAGAPAWPIFRVQVTGDAPAQQLVVTETTPGGVLHGCNFSIRIADGAGATANVRIVRGVDGVATATVPTGVPWTVATTSLDPHAECLAYPELSLVSAPLHPPGWSPWRGSLATSP